MQFENPEILSLFFLLIIPIIIHLFQLQKFVKTPFTNVAFLQKLEQQTRKSSRIKKWLLLACRILLFSAILFAFSKPYLSSKENNKLQHHFIYLDNSLSTNAKGKKGNLLQVCIQEIINSTAESDMYSLQTNSNFYKNLSKKELKKVLLKIENTSKSIDISTINLKVNKEKNSKTKSLYKGIYISDFQNYKNTKFTNVTPSFSLIKLHPSLQDNVSIDSVFINNKNATKSTISVLVKNQGSPKENVPISLYNQSHLISKQSFSIEKDSNMIIEFTLQNLSDFKGKLTIPFSDTFLFDNSFFFTIEKQKKLNVLAIGKRLPFLEKVYTEEEFNFNHSLVQNTNYNTITNQNLIILSQLENIPQVLSKRLQEYVKNGGSIVCIPNQKINIGSYNIFLKSLRVDNIKNQQKDTLKITSIQFNHPLLKDVFVKKVKNFQYPNVNSYLNFTTKGKSNQILTFENNIPFLQNFSNLNGELFLFSSPLDKDISNFTNSPLIVPTFYNFAKFSFKPSNIFYRLNKEAKIDVDTELSENDILTINRDNKQLIPLQRKFKNKVSLTLNDELEKNGFYYILNKQDTLKTIAFNNPITESNLNFLDLNTLKTANKNVNISSSISSLFNEISKKNEVHWLWKWFLSLAIVSLLLEILILKFYKT